MLGQNGFFTTNLWTSPVTRVYNTSTSRLSSSSAQNTAPGRRWCAYTMARREEADKCRLMRLVNNTLRRGMAVLEFGLAFEITVTTLRFE